MSAKSPWTAAIVMVGAALMDMIDITILNVALPTIGSDLGTSGSELQWVISAYLLAFAAALITSGRVGDLLGRKRVFVAGIIVFGLTSLAAGLAQDPVQLIAARVVQGLAAAAMVPQVLGTFRAMFSGEERGKAFGLYGAILGFASALGLVLGGVLTEADLFGWSWRPIFLINVPIAIGAAIAAIRVVPETRERSAARPDVVGAVVLSASLVAIAYPLLEGREHGWPVWTWAVLGVGVLGLVVLGFVESRRPSDRIAPLLLPRLLRIPAFSAGLVVMTVFAAGLQGLFVTFALWIQLGQGFSPLAAGLVTTAFSIGGFLLAPSAAALAQRFGRTVLSLGAAMMAGGTVWMGLTASAVGTDGSRWWPIAPGLVIAGAGLSLLVIPLVNVVLAAVPAHAAGGAGGQFSTAQQLGGALGVATVGTVFFSALESHGDYTEAFTTALPVSVGLLVVAAALSMLLPKTAVAEEQAIAA
jgi:EmrB/QacA subfamily drug resistance transporter